LACAVGEAGLLFRTLQELEVGTAATFDDVLRGWGAARGQGRVAIILSDLLLDGYQSGVRQLVGAGFQVLLLHVLSPEELHPPMSGDLELVDSETGQTMEVHLNPETLAVYGRRLDAGLAETAAWCQRQGAAYLLVESDWDIERVLLETLRRRGVTA
jgi:hypothetical protein